jgi:hypothetical protein
MTRTRNTAALIPLLVVLVLFAACDRPPSATLPVSQASGTVAAPSPPHAGRYVFYPEPSSPTKFMSGGVLLDTATGEMWSLEHVMVEGRFGPSKLYPVAHSTFGPKQ